MQVRFVRWLVGLFVFLWCWAASAKLTVTVENILGRDVPCSHEWIEFAVTIENLSAGTEEGTIVVASNASTGPRVRTPFRVAGNTIVRVHVPAYIENKALGVSVLDADGQSVFGPLYFTSDDSRHLLLNAAPDPRLASALEESLSRYPLNSPFPVSVSSSPIDRATGEALLPERSATYLCAELVVLRSDQLTKLQGKQLAALLDYVRTGGVLAVSITREQDVQHQVLRSLVGQELRIGPPNDDMRMEVVDPITSKPLTPSEPLAASLSSFTGGSLRPTVLGAVAKFGWGEVHLLGFDPTRSPGVNDPWAIARMRYLAELAVGQARPSRQGQSWDSHSPAMRKALDPNESGRWSIVVSVLLLVAYAILAGPITFRRCAKRGKSLRAFWLLPVWSVLFFAAVLIVGGVVKGWPGHAGRLTLIQSTSGMTRAPAVRLRALFTAGARQLTIRSSESTGMLRPFDAGQALEVDRDGMRLVGIATAPWNVVVAREDGFFDLGRGLSVVQEGSDVRVVNNTGRELRSVVVVPMFSEPAYFAKIGDGATVLLSQGHRVERFGPDRSALPKRVISLLNDATPGLGDAWCAVEGFAFNRAEAPVVLAMVEAGESDIEEPLRLKQQHVLLRVVGNGGDR